MTEPTDNDLDVLLAEHWPAFATSGARPLQGMRAAMREAIAKWGTPPAVAGEPVEMCLCESHRLVLRLGQPYIFREMEGCESCKTLADQAREAYGPTGGAPAVTPQPTKAQAGAVPLTDEQIRAMLNKHPPEDVCGWSYRMGIDDAELHHGIKGGQHG